MSILGLNQVTCKFKCNSVYLLLWMKPLLLFESVKNYYSMEIVDIPFLAFQFTVMVFVYQRGDKALYIDAQLCYLAALLSLGDLATGYLQPNMLVLFQPLVSSLPSCQYWLVEPGPIHNKSPSSL